MAKFCRYTHHKVISKFAVNFDVAFVSCAQFTLLYCCIGHYVGLEFMMSNMHKSTTVLRSSVISRKSGGIDCEILPEKATDFFVFYCFENPSNTHNFGITSPIQVRFSAKRTSPNEYFNQIEN